MAENVQYFLAFATFSCRQQVKAVSLQLFVVYNNKEHLVAVIDCRNDGDGK